MHRFFAKHEYDDGIGYRIGVRRMYIEVGWLYMTGRIGPFTWMMGVSHGRDLEDAQEWEHWR